MKNEKSQSSLTDKKISDKLALRISLRCWNGKNNTNKNPDFRFRWIFSIFSHVISTNWNNNPHTNFEENKKTQTTKWTKWSRTKFWNKKSRWKIFFPSHALRGQKLLSGGMYKISNDYFFHSSALRGTAFARDFSPKISKYTDKIRLFFYFYIYVFTLAIAKR